MTDVFYGTHLSSLRQIKFYITKLVFGPVVDIIEVSNSWFISSKKFWLKLLTQFEL